ncbi:F-box protein DOR-like [Capsella rubella]|uniref:F-box protein DOR-like n=1 Tax=Capsella rubella TaxID=81985 RepID=UPI000CD5066B|nr:F-box protein DOR-like [Capsella rubella]
MDGRDSSGPLHADLIIEILLRLPSKSIARCRCVSKVWSSILGLAHFTELFLKKSSARPQILFALKDYDKMWFFSSPQPQNIPDENLPAVTATYHMSVRFDHRYTNISPINGLFCLRTGRNLKGRQNPLLELVIFNPSTGQSLVLPKMKTMRRVGLHSYLGYDPVEKLFKVLSMSWLVGGRNISFEEHQVLTLGTREPSWRMIECSRPHFTLDNNGICINGVLYYKAADNMYSEDSMVVCFDVRSEKFRFIEGLDNFRSGTLINYNDAEEHEWWEYTYVLPAWWPNIVGPEYFSLVGVTLTNEIVLSPSYFTGAPFHVIYYNTEKMAAVKLHIQGMEAIKYHRQLLTFLDYVEDMKLMQMF